MKLALRHLAQAGVAIAAIAIAQPAAAEIIDFESGFAALDPVGAVVTATNTVTFSVGPGTTGGVGPAFIADVGGPTTAFVPHDTPEAGAAGRIGEFFLTDETAGPSAALNYFIEFADPVASLGLDLIDFRRDGGPSAGDTATLTVYSDSFSTAVGFDIFTIPLTNPVDGNVERLMVSLGGKVIKSASIVFSTPDVGTGIDNITFVPEPATLALLGIGLAGIGAGRRRRARPARG